MDPIALVFKKASTGSAVTPDLLGDSLSSLLPGLLQLFGLLIEVGELLTAHRFVIAILAVSFVGDFAE